VSARTTTIDESRATLEADPDMKAAPAWRRRSDFGAGIASARSVALVDVPVYPIGSVCFIAARGSILRQIPWLGADSVISSLFAVN
jgi:hypothetical protein